MEAVVKISTIAKRMLRTLLSFLKVYTSVLY